MSDAFFEKTEARRKELDQLLVPAIKVTEADVSALANGAKCWGDHFGAIGIDPKHLTVYFVLPKRRDVDGIERSPQWAAIKTKLTERMRAAGYPVDRLSGDWVGLYSEQECQEEAKGNWYHFFK